MKDFDSFSMNHSCCILAVLSLVLMLLIATRDQLTAAMKYEHRKDAVILLSSFFPIGVTTDLTNGDATPTIEKNNIMFP
jgi:hypothetical protein